MSNYNAWKINPHQFPQAGTLTEQLKFLIGYAILAPSSHNSQPWLFQIKDNAIFIKPNLERHLPVCDHNNRQLYISLGASAQFLELAAEYFGFAFKTKTYINPSTGLLEAVMVFERVHDNFGTSDHLLHQITKRVTDRLPYKPEAIPNDFLQHWTQASGADFSLKFVSDPEPKYKIADAVLAALIEAMDDKAFRHELFPYVRNNKTKSFLGMPASGFGIPTPISFVAPYGLKTFNVNKLRRKMDEKLLKYQTPAFMIISTSSDNTLAWFKTGQAYGKLSLAATQAGLSTGVMAGAIQIGDYYQTLQQALNINLRPQLFARIGYSTQKQLTPSPRLLIESVLR